MNLSDAIAGHILFLHAAGRSETTIETSVYHLRRFCNELSDPELDALTSQAIT